MHKQDYRGQNLKEAAANGNTFRVANKVAMMPHTMTRKDSHLRAPTRCRARLLGTYSSSPPQVQNVNRMRHDTCGTVSTHAR